MSLTNSAGEHREAVLGQRVPALPPSYYFILCVALLSGHMLLVSAANLLQSGFYQLYPSGQHFSFMELFHGGFAIQIILWRESHHFPNSSLSPLYFLLCMCVHIYIFIYFDTHIYAYMYICLLQNIHIYPHRGQQQKFSSVSAGASCRPISPGCVCSLFWGRITGFTDWEWCLQYTDLGKGKKKKQQPPTTFF